MIYSMVDYVYSCFMKTQVFRLRIKLVEIQQSHFDQTEIIL